LIDVTPYQQRLELCKEWMYNKIDGILPLKHEQSGTMVAINIGVVPKMSWEEVLRLWGQTGIIVYRHDPFEKLRPVTFEEYCELKQLIKI
jgi:hypothetical protein